MLVVCLKLLSFSENRNILKNSKTILSFQSSLLKYHHRLYLQDGDIVRNVAAWLLHAVGTALSVNAVYWNETITASLWAAVWDTRIIVTSWCLLCTSLWEPHMPSSITPYTCGWSMLTFMSTFCPYGKCCVPSWCLSPVHCGKICSWSTII